MTGALSELADVELPDGTKAADRHPDRVGDAIMPGWTRGSPSRRTRGTDYGAIGVALGSIGMGIPLTAIAGSEAGVAGVLVTWIGIVVVNVLYGRSER